MLAFTLDRRKKWRLPHWSKDCYINFKDDRWWSRNTGGILFGEGDISSDQWEEYIEPQPQPEPELEWRVYNGDYFLGVKLEEPTVSRPATEAELRAIRKSLGIKGE